MDQDFHYYGTFYSALCGGFDKDDATLIAKASNFIDFFNQKLYDSPWNLITDTKKSSRYTIVAKLENLRHTFQDGVWNTYDDPQDGLWCSFHFTPGNFNDPAGTPSREQVHGVEVANYLPGHVQRNTYGGENVLRYHNPGKLTDLQFGKLLNRPQSALARRLVQDTLLCVSDEDRLEKIIALSLGGETLLKGDRADLMRRFKLILLGIRAHVVADTWAHQDHCGLHNVLNTYWDVKWDMDTLNPLTKGWGRASIDYNDGTSKDWENKILTSLNNKWAALIPGNSFPNPNLEAAPNATSYLGHAWLGHMPDYSFVKFRYKPCWANPKETIERDNPKEYRAAWVELTSLFYQAKTGRHLTFDDQLKHDIEKASQAIQSPCKLSDYASARTLSKVAWLRAFSERPGADIDVMREPDPHTVLDGMIEGKDHVNIRSDLYLFQIAADYHFQFVKHYLEKNGIYHFTGSWSQPISALSPAVVKLFE